MRLIEIYVDNIGRAINTRHAELHKSISDSYTMNRIFRFFSRDFFLSLSFFYGFSFSWKYLVKIHDGKMSNQKRIDVKAKLIINFKYIFQIEIFKVKIYI